MADSADPAPPPPPPSRNPLKRLYHWVLSWSDRRFGGAFLFGFAIAESFFFPIPPDPLLIALILGKREKAWRFALLCTVGSVIGGALGYLIGLALWESTNNAGTVVNAAGSRVSFSCASELPIACCALVP